MEKQKQCPLCGKSVASSALEGLCPECLLKGGLETGVDVGGDTQTDAGSARPRFVAPTASELEPLFPQLEILELIGQGGMGAVYKARQKELDRIVALKILPPDIGHDPAFSERFSLEAKALARLNHPGIVTIHDFGKVPLPSDGKGEDLLRLIQSKQPCVSSTESNFLFFFLMEYVDGVNLQQLLHGERLSPREALSIVPQICDALQYAHDHGIVHRDIKPENILLDRRGSVKVADFGLAKMMADSLVSEDQVSKEEAGSGELTQKQKDLTEYGKIMGTPKYMSPEQIESPKSVDHRADIYALGVVFYQMLTGKLPGKNLEAPSKKVSIDVRLDEIVLRALERNPTKRYQDASAFKTQLESVAATDSHGDANIPKSSLEESETYLKSIPWQVWVVISVLGLESIFNLFSTPNQPEAAGWLLAKILFIAGLVLRWKPVYVVFLAVCVVHVVYFAAPQPMTAALNLILLILTGTQYRFYYDPSEQQPMKPANWMVLMRALAWTFWLLSIPAIGFGAFFANALMAEQGGWNPNLAEAIFVPLTWVCALLFSCLGWFLWKQSGSIGCKDSHSKGSLRDEDKKIIPVKWNETFGIMGVVLMLFLTATGNAIIMAIGAGIAVIVCLFCMPRNKFLYGLLVALASMGLAAWAGMLMSGWL